MSIMAIDLDETDREILTVLATGRATPSYLSKQTDVTRQTVQNRLKPLRAADFVEKIDTGLYEITEKGRQTQEVEARR
jgi:predicted transcriptional regulator